MSIKRKNNEENEEISHKDKKVKFQNKSLEKNNTTKEQFINKNSGFNKGKLNPSESKPEDWSKFKQEKKELRIKRKSTKNNFDIIVKAKKMGELLRRKALKNGEAERNKLINELHMLLKSKGEYGRFVLSHDTSRIIQWLLKYSSPIIRSEIVYELKGVIVNMMQSKYAVFCVKRLLKYGNPETRSVIIEQFYGHVVKLASHAVSAPVLEYAYSTWATPAQKQFMNQEFYGDIYKNTKDDTVKCLKNVFENTPNLKSAALTACKSNLSRIMNKSLLDSGLVQSVLHQFLIECSSEDRKEFITQLSSHAVILSNSKDGSKVVMQCIWQGSNKDRKTIMKVVKEHLVELCKHEYGHRTIITLLDSADDTVVLNKIIVSEIINNIKTLSTNEWGRKVLLWLAVPGDNTYFHPVFIKELTDGLLASTSKKSVEIRRKEILSFSIDNLLKAVTEDTEFWLSNSKVAYEMLGFIKHAQSSEFIKGAFDSISQVIVNPDWKIEETSGIEHAGMHLVLKKILKNDKNNLESNSTTFGESLIENLTEDVLKSWVVLNRGCFLLVVLLENNCAVESKLKEKLEPLQKLISKQKTSGAKILLKNLKK